MGAIEPQTGWAFPVVAGLLGAVVGSFLNVVIHRLPRGQSVVRGRSTCPGCKRTIAWYDNVPLVSYLVLRGRCRGCQRRISPRYPLVEALAAAAAVAVVWVKGWTLAAAWTYAFVAILIAVTFIDWEHQVIPDPLSLGGVVLGWAGAWICLDMGVAESILGAVVGAGVVLVIAVAYRALRRVEGMGGGDVKLMAMIGAFLGWPMVFPVLFIAALAGSMYGLYLVRARGGDGKTAVAFGSFLSPAAGLMVFVGDRLVSLYYGAALWAAR